LLFKNDVVIFWQKKQGIWEQDTVRAETG